MFAKLFVAAGLAALAAAQSATLGFTSVPKDITAGQPEAIEYKAADLNSPVTIILRKGASTDLKTISTLTSSATGGKYTWTPSTSLVSGSDYALQITQGSETNYYGPFALAGGAASGSSSSASASVTSSASHSASGYPSHISSIITSASRNATTILTGTGSVGTGYPISRNTTMSRPTLSATTGASASTTGSGSSQSTGAGAGFQGSSTGSPAASSTGGAAMLTTGGSVVALVFGAVAAAVFA
ncbi:hypothetical protein PRZ48_001655 [Zasmidium cellare]|uniref:Yeast cell wall synthesis Kre9/Knh1-like N-terminal domain-containing protein n=1 Tax=Zasmidium cellare TaxID=395010 RepID=A0ABR0F2K1_ZASCE|nr:hypothetical protein PRZ48_001655 [Zasmidium cellare]